MVARDGLDSCLRGQSVAGQADEPLETLPVKKKADRKAAPAPQPERAEDYLQAPDIGAPVPAEPPPPQKEAPAPEVATPPPPEEPEAELPPEPKA